MPRSYRNRSALSQLPAATAWDSRPTVIPWAGPTRPDCHAADHTVALSFSAAPHIQRIWTLGDMWAAVVQVAEFVAGLPQFADLPNCRSTLISSFPNLHHPVGPLPLRLQAGPLHVHSLPLFTLSHLIQWYGVRRLSAI